MSAEGTTQRLLVWRVGGMRCAAPVERLREILPDLPIALLPGAPKGVRGVANVRGELVTVVDGRTLAGAPDTKAPEAVVLVRVGRRTVGLAVDQVEDLFLVPDDALRPPGTGRESGWTARLDDAEPARLLDLDELLGPMFPD